MSRLMAPFICLRDQCTFQLKNDVANQFYWPNTVIRHKAYLHFGKLWNTVFCVNSRFHATTCRGLAFKILHIYCCAEMKFPGRLHSSKVSKFCRQCIFQHLVKVLDPANLYHWWLWYMELFRDEMFCSVLITLFQHFFLFRSVPNDLKELLAAGNLQDTEKIL